MKKTILVLGGAGYIGSYVNKHLHKQGFKTVVIDDLRRGFKKNVPQGFFFEHDFGDHDFLKEIFSNYHVDAVIHLAALTDVGESVFDPKKYYDNNVVKTLTLLNTMVECDVKHLIFSSSAAVYGTPNQDKIKEDHPKNPINPYGDTKLFVEKILENYRTAYGLKSCSLRYFNAAGADPDNELKLHVEKMSNLIPLLIRAIHQNRPIQIFGNDYDTRDGTCVRDYIHIHDLATAHTQALLYLLNDGPITAFNLGNGEGFSVKEVIDTAAKVLDAPIPTIIAPRRVGDPPILLADASLAKKVLNWQPIYPDLATIFSHAWQASL